jgi:hypothetical protein
MSVGVELLLTAQDNATAAVAGVGRGVQQLERQAGTVTQSFNQAGRQVRVLAGELTSELSPALGQIVQRASMAGGAVGGMSAGVAAATVAVVAATAVLSAYLRAINETAERQAALNIAVRGFDAGAIRSQLQGISLDMETMNKRTDSLLGRLQNTFKAWTDALGFTTDNTVKLREAQAALNQVIPVDRALALADAYSRQQETLQGLLAIEAQRAAASSNLSAIVTLHERLEQSLSNQATAEEKLIELQRQKDVGAARARNETEAAIAAINEKAAEAKRTLGQRAGVQIEANRFAGQNAFFPAFSAQSQRDVESSVGFGLEQVGLGPTPAELVRGFAIQKQLALDILALDKERATIGTQLVGLTENERDAMSLIAVNAQRRLELAQAQGDVEKEQVATLRAQVETFNILQQQREREDPISGVAKGFKDAAEEASQSGRLMQKFARDTASAMHQEFSDGFFSLLTGDFKKLPDIGKQYGTALIRAFSDALAQAVTAPIFQTLARGFGGLTGAGGGGGGLGALAVTAGSAGVGSVISTAQGPAVVTPGGGLHVIGQPMAAAGAGFSAQAGISPSGGVAGMLPAPPLGSFGSGIAGPIGTLLNTSIADIANYGFSTAYTAAALAQQGITIGAANVAAFQGLSAAEIAGLYSAAAAEGTAAGVGVGASGAAVGAGTQAAGITVGAALGAVGAVVGFGLSLYGAYQSGSPTYGAISGAISGAVAGAVIGSIFPGVGTVVGAVVGLVVGAAAGAGAGAAGKKGPSHKEREAKEANRAIGFARDMVKEIGTADSWGGLYQIIGLWSSPTYGGVKGIAVIVETSLGTVALQPDPSIRQLSVDEFRRSVDTVQAFIQAGVDRQLLADANEAIAQAIKEQGRRLKERDNLVQQFRENAFFAFDESFTRPGVRAEPGLGAYDRETFLPISRAKEATGKELLVNQGVLRAAAAAYGLTDNEFEGILRNLARVDADRNLGYINAERYAL